MARESGVNEEVSDAVSDESYEYRPRGVSGEPTILTAAQLDEKLASVRSASDPSKPRAAIRRSHEGLRVRAETLERALTDFAEKGLRADLAPTMDCRDVGTLYAGFARYLSRVDEGVRERARSALAAGGSPEGDAQ